MNPKVEWFFQKDTQWQEAYQLLRDIVLDCGLTEELKWGVPCYTFQQHNIVLIHGFKRYCALLFHKGVLLNDTSGLLIQQTKNVQSARQLRFANTEEIDALESIIREYIYEAIEVEKAGLEVVFKETSAFAMPEEFQKALDDSAKLRGAFEALSPGRQRGYLLHFAQPKQAKTRLSRIEKCRPKILNGEGLHDQYQRKSK